MPTLRVPSQLKYYLDNQTDVALTGETVGDILRELVDQYPKIQSHIFDDKGQVRRHINLFVNKENIRDLKGLGTPVGEHDIVKVVPSVTGG